MRANTPSVTTSIARARRDQALQPHAQADRLADLLRPASTPCARAAARAARRRGSSTMILPARAKGSSSSASGTRVVLPAPGGATSTARVPALSAATSRGRASSIGKRFGKGAHRRLIAAGGDRASPAASPRREAQLGASFAHVAGRAPYLAISATATSTSSALERASRSLARRILSSRPVRTPSAPRASAHSMTRD